MTAHRRVRSARTPGADDGETLADALEVAAAALRAGLSPSAALALVADATAWGAREAVRVEAVRRRMALGRPTREAWCRPGDSRGEADAHHAVAGVWDLALQTGGPLADAVDDLAGHLREEARLRGRLEALAAGPRTSRRLLTVLPLAGPVLAVLIGADLGQLYASSIAGAASVLTGIALTGVGWWWSRSMVEAATRPRPYPVATEP
jgi:tight adherence protein B